MNKVIKLILVLIFSVTLLTGCGCEKDKNNKKEETKEEIKVNKNEEVTKDQELEVFKFTNTSLVYEEGTSVLETVVTNTSSEEQYLKEFKINVRDKDGNIIITLTGFIGDSLGAGQSKIITSSYGDDLTKAASIDYEIVK